MSSLRVFTRPVSVATVLLALVVSAFAVSLRRPAAAPAKVAAAATDEHVTPPAYHPQKHYSLYRVLPEGAKP